MKIQYNYSPHTCIIQKRTNIIFKIENSYINDFWKATVYIENTIFIVNDLYLFFLFQ